MGSRVEGSAGLNPFFKVFSDLVSQFRSYQVRCLGDGPAGYGCKFEVRRTLLFSI